MTKPEIGQRWLDTSGRALVIVGIYEDHGPKFYGQTVALCDQYHDGVKALRRTSLTITTLVARHIFDGIGPPDNAMSRDDAAIIEAKRRYPREEQTALRSAWLNGVGWADGRRR